MAVVALASVLVAPQSPTRGKRTPQNRSLTPSLYGAIPTANPSTYRSISYRHVDGCDRRWAGLTSEIPAILGHVHFLGMWAHDHDASSLVPLRLAGGAAVHRGRLGLPAAGGKKRTSTPLQNRFCRARIPGRP